jgi:release factor glutamine methyltransferase
MTAAASETRTWRSLWVEATEQIGDANEARWICQQACGLDATEWATSLDQPATRGAVVRLDAMVGRRRAGEPLAYVLGGWAFRRLDLMVDRRVLIPRPETELVVEVALETAFDLGLPLTIADLGTGSGAIALALADELPLREVAIWATDTSSDALDVARANLAGLGRAAANVRLAAGSWWEALPAELAGVLDLVVTNPPYVADTDELEASVSAWEPPGALRAGAGGLDALREIVAGARRWLRAGGALVSEIGATQGDAVRALATEAGLTRVEIRRDLAGRDRVLTARAAPV